MSLLTRFTRLWTATRFRETLHLDDPTWRLALSLAVGVFISFTPFYGLQTLLAVGIAMLCRLNRAATVAGAWLNLPWFAPLIYAGALRFGTLLLPDPSSLLPDRPHLRQRKYDASPQVNGVPPDSGSECGSSD